MQTSSQGAPAERLAYKINEAAALLGVSPVTIRRAIQKGLFRPIRAFRHPLIPASQINALLQKANS